MNNSTNLNNNNPNFTSGQQPWPNSDTTPQPTPSPVPPGVVAPSVPGTQTEPSTTTAPLDDGVMWQDVISQAQNPGSTVTSTNNFLTPYTTYSNQPVLPQATVNDPSLANAGLQFILNPSSQLINQVIQSLSDFMPKNSLSDDSQQYANVPVSNPDINERAQQLGIAPGVLLHNIQSDQQSLFSQFVSKLPPDVANQLTFAEYSPKGSITLSPQLQGQLMAIQEQVRQGLINNFGLPITFGLLNSFPPDTTNFQMQLSVEADNAFSQQISQMIAAGTITPQEARTLMAMQGGMTEGTPHLKVLLQNIQTNVQFQMQTQYGFDSSFQIKPDTSFYNNVVNGDFAQTYQKNVAKYTGTATAEQKELLKQYAANPNDPSIPDSIKQLAQQIAAEQQLLLQAFPDPNNSSLPDNLKDAANQLIEETRNTIIENYGLDTTWQPTITSLVAPGIDSNTLQILNNAMSFAKNVVDGAENLANSLPPIPEKGMFLSYLKAIGDALNKLQDSIYAMEASQSNTANSMSTAKMTSALDNLAKQKRAMDKAEKAAHKMASLGPLGKIFEWIFKIIMVMMSVVGGPAGIAMALFYVTDSAVAEIKGQDSLVQKMFQAIAKSLPPGAASVLSFLLAAELSIISCNPLLAMHLIMQDSHFIQNAIKACGGNEQAQALGAMVCNLVIQVAIIVVMIILTGGAATPALTAQVAQMLAQTLKIASETAEMMVKISSTVMNVILSSLQITQQAVLLNNNILLAQIDTIKGAAEAYSEQIEGLVQVMQKIIDSLLGLIQGNADNIATINNIQGQKWTDASQLISQIAG